VSDERRLAMGESVLVTVFPALFLVVLFGGGALMRRRSIDMDGEAPIGRAVFYASKYSIVIVWAATVAHSWGAGFSLLRAPEFVTAASLCLWVLGFLLLFIGRFGLGESFRLGSPKESTGLKVDGLFRLSRNPMYLGVYATLFASVLYTLNPVLLLVAIFVAAVHHRIVVAEEQHLRGVFGQEYLDYCARVRRYL
jgi:protein-S-isoprenylcysteine O-methyltransferase Ste14